MSTMTQNHNTLIEMLQRLIPSPGQVSGPHMLDASFHVATQETLVKNQEDLQKEININNVTLKQEIEMQVLQDMEARLNSKIGAISKIVEKRKTKNHCQQRSNSDMSLSSSSSSEPPSNHKEKMKSTSSLQTAPA